MTRIALRAECSNTLEEKGKKKRKGKGKKKTLDTICNEQSKKRNFSSIIICEVI